jgi:hypothetical protein
MYSFICWLKVKRCIQLCSVEVLYFNPECYEFCSRWRNWISFRCYPPRPHYGPASQSVSNNNEYHFFVVCTFKCIFFVRVGPPLWSSGQSSWLQIRRPGFDSRHYQKKIVGLERGPTTEELLDRKVTVSV